jgi:hypothetical protein
MLRQNAIAKAGAVQAAIIGAEVETASTATASKVVSRGPGKRIAESGTPHGEAPDRSTAAARLLP